MKKILFLQNDRYRFSPSRVDLRFAGAGLDVEYCWAASGEFPVSAGRFSGAFVYASPHGAYEDIDWIHREHDLLRELAHLEIPMLGICFGSQILASALCGRDQVFQRQECEVGYKWVDLNPGSRSDLLVQGLGDRVFMFIWHNDEVRSGHMDMRLLGHTDLCPTQIWRYRDLPIWGIQGHPELTREQAQSFFQQHRAKLERDGADVDDLIDNADEAVEAKALLNNFIQYCTGTVSVPGFREVN